MQKIIIVLTAMAAVLTLTGCVTIELRPEPVEKVRIESKADAGREVQAE